MQVQGGGRGPSPDADALAPTCSGSPTEAARVQLVPGVPEEVGSAERFPDIVLFPPPWHGEARGFRAALTCVKCQLVSLIRRPPRERPTRL